MRKMNQCLVMAGMAAILSLGSSQVVAQDNNPPGQDRQRGRGGFGGGNFNFRQARLDAFKEKGEFTDEDWKAVEPLVQKVTDAQEKVLADRIRSAMGGNRFRGGGPGGDNNNSGDRGDRGGRGGGFFNQTPSPEAEALQKAIDGKAPNSELKTALAKFIESRKANQKALEDAQANLKKVLTVRQEAIAA